MILPLGRLKRTANEMRENLAFYPSQVLAKVAADGDFASDSVRSRCVAELLVRRYLNPSSVQDEWLDQVLGDSWSNMNCLLDELVLLNPSERDVPDQLWQPTSDFSRLCETAARRRVRVLFGETDGFIPVFVKGKHDTESQGFFLPFHFEERGEKPCICDASGEPIEGWVDAYESLPGLASEFTCVVACHQQDLPPLKGHSLMLPLFLGYHRKKGTLPQYNHLRLLATGAFENGRLTAVEVEEKLEQLSNQFAHGQLFCPESERYCLNDWRCVTLATGLTGEEVLEVMRMEIEAKGLVVPTFREACLRLEQLSDDIQYSNYSRWDRMLERLQTNEKAMDEDRDPQRFLLCLMLKSAVNCHKGNTDEALRLNQEAREFALEHDCQPQLRRLGVEELVEFQDQEEFGLIGSLAQQLAESMADSSDDDLLMRYHGTMGQAHCYGYLAGVESFSKDQAKCHFKQALKHAYKLNSEGDIAQDLNYCYLWQALFNYGTPEAQRAYDKAKCHILCNLKEDCRTKNLFFLQRFHLMEWYRQLLATGTVEVSDLQRERIPDTADFWLRALSDKYLGALATAQGKTEWARVLFDEGVELLGDATNSIIGYIRMTVLAEAYRSLGDERYRVKALEAIEALRPKYAESIQSWEEFLNDKGPFPGLNYWY